jgi:hypothetical protein
MKKNLKIKSEIAKFLAFQHSETKVSGAQKIERFSWNSEKF